MSNPVNLVFVHLAHLRCDSFAFNGNQSISTPGFDFLAKNGVYYSNVFNQQIRVKDQLRASSSFINELVPNGTSFSFWSSLLTKGYVFYESHFDSHPISAREVGRQSIYPRIIQKDHITAKIEAKTDKELARWSTFVEKSDKPFVAHFTSDDLLAPFQAEQKYYDSVDSLKISQRETKQGLNGNTNSIFGTSIWEENHWLEMRRTYLAQIAKIDDGIVYLIEVLKKFNKLSNTAIIVYGQGAPALGDFGFEIVPTHELRESYVHVPLFVKYPDEYHIEAGTHSGLFGLADIWPTIFQLMGFTIPLTFKKQGAVSLLAGEQREWITGNLVSKTLFGHHKVGSYVKTPQHFLVQQSSHTELFLSSDPFGLTNLSHQKDNAALIRELKSK